MNFGPHFAVQVINDRRRNIYAKARLPTDVIPFSIFRLFIYFLSALVWACWKCFKQVVHPCCFFSYWLFENDSSLSWHKNSSLKFFHITKKSALLFRRTLLINIFNFYLGTKKRLRFYLIESANLFQIFNFHENIVFISFFHFQRLNHNEISCDFSCDFFGKIGVFYGKIFPNTEKFFQPKKQQTA